MKLSDRCRTCSASTHTHTHTCTKTSVCEACTVYQLLMSLSPLPLISSLSRTCVSECPSGFFRDDKKRCKKCSSLCETCVGSRSDQCTSCRAGYHLSEGTNTCVSSCAESYYLDHGTLDVVLSPFRAVFNPESGSVRFWSLTGEK